MVAAALTVGLAADNRLDRKQFQSFGPDTIPEARNRGLKAT